MVSQCVISSGGYIEIEHTCIVIRISENEVCACCPIDTWYEFFICVKHVCLTLISLHLLISWHWIVYSRVPGVFRLFQ